MATSVSGTYTNRWYCQDRDILTLADDHSLQSCSTWPYASFGETGPLRSDIGRHHNEKETLIRECSKRSNLKMITSHFASLDATAHECYANNISHPNSPHFTSPHVLRAHDMSDGFPHASMARRRVGVITEVCRPEGARVSLATSRSHSTVQQLVFTLSLIQELQEVSNSPFQDVASYMEDSGRWDDDMGAGRRWGQSSTQSAVARSERIGIRR